MDLTIPQHWQGDLGRDVPPEEWPEIVPSITPIEKITCRVCYVESTNDKWRLGEGVMIKFKGGEWPVVRKFDCHILDFAYESGGDYFTVLPISPLEYRRGSPTKACVVLREDPQETHFDIFSDYGEKYTVTVTNDMPEVIEAAISAAKAQELLAEPQ